MFAYYRFKADMIYFVIIGIRIIGNKKKEHIWQIRSWKRC